MYLNNRRGSRELAAEGHQRFDAFDKECTKNLEQTYTGSLFYRLFGVLVRSRHQVRILLRGRCQSIYSALDSPVRSRRDRVFSRKSQFAQLPCTLREDAAQVLPVCQRQARYEPRSFPLTLGVRWSIISDVSTGRSSAWLERCVRDAEAASSNLAAPTTKIGSSRSCARTPFLFF